MTEHLTKDQVKRLWIHAQRLDQAEPFGSGPSAVQSAVEHLGYVQIDTINVIERCHHHILFNRIPQYKKQDLHRAQTKEKTIFEYWTHALSIVPTRDFKFYIGAMKRTASSPGRWLKTVKPHELQKVLRLIKKDGAQSIRDIEDEVLVEKNHPWASRKPSKEALQFGFYTGRLVVSERVGMLKKYELTERHFEWKKKPKAATEKEALNYSLDRALRSQFVVSLDSICYLEPKKKSGMSRLIDARVKNGRLLIVRVKGIEKVQVWIQPEDLELKFKSIDTWTHILSPFDPLIIHRKRLDMFFNYAHRFEAYVPKDKRIFGYFALPVLLDDQIIAAIDMKTDRAQGKLLIQKWNWIGKGKTAINKKRIEEELQRFEKFQLGI